MKKSHPVALIVATAVITALFCFRFPEPAIGVPQAERPETNEGPGRFQLSSDEHGYCILDTHTGVLWRAYHSQKPRRINDPL